VVPDLEGSEATKFLHEIGVSVFVLNYRTKTEATKNEPWKRPLQDSQRAVRYVRANAGKWGVDKGKVGILAFSAGGQVGAIHLGAPDSEWKTTGKVDQESSQLDFAMLIYPWKVLDGKTGKLMEPIKLGKEAPPTFIVHTSDDASTSLGAVEMYAQLKKSGVSSELHVYQNGGHGYGVREKKGSAIGKWSAAAADWLVLRGIGKKGS
jgi:acetyl esterase/lipase